MLLQTWTFSALAAASLLLDGVFAFKGGHGKFHERSIRKQERAQHEAAQRLQAERKALEARQANDTQQYRFYCNDTAPYFVDSLPDVPFDLGEMYAGNVPIDTNDLSRQLFFVFQPTIGEPVDEVTVWLNGGPGCSSLEGFFQENGRFVWQPGTFAPVENPYSWVNVTNMLWVEQPIGTGFTLGTPTASSEEEIAQDFIKAFKNFETLFGIKNFKIYITGESYAGRYVPYFSAAMLNENDTEYYDLKGALVYDPCIGQYDYVQEEVPAVPYVVQNNNLFNFNDSFIAELQFLHESCGYAAYIDQYLTFPPSGVQPPVYFNYTSQANCDIFDLIDFAAFDANPCFDIYEINTQCPLLWDVLAFPTQLVYTPDGATTYFNRSDVKAALHAPANITWAECNSGVFPQASSGAGPESEGDISADPIQHVLPQVIEATNRVLVGNGDYDMIILTNGTLMAIQNMTWNGQLGFQQQPSAPINITIPDLQYASVFASSENSLPGWDGPQGVQGIQHFERGLMWVETFQAGHMQPEYQPRSAYRHLLWLLGHTEVI